MIKEAQYYQTLENNQAECLLCPHNCIIQPGKRGLCNVRKNSLGKLISENFSLVSAIHSDPIEKKPLYHFYPGKNILSIGSIGCNLKCKFCQNCSISQIGIEDFDNAKYISSGLILKEAKRTRNNIGVAYTYNEPTVWFEFMLETAEKVSKEMLKNVVVSNGYINEDPLSELCQYVDAFNIDLKAFTENFYKKQTGASLTPVLKTIEYISKSNCHLEITNLIIPTLNDEIEIFKEMLNELLKISGKDTVLHLSRYYPSYKTNISATEKDTMLRFFSTAKEYLNYVYMGNIITDRGQNTYCPNCNNKLISRNKYYTQVNGLRENKCLICQTEIPIII